MEIAVFSVGCTRERKQIEREREIKTLRTNHSLGCAHTRANDDNDDAVEQGAAQGAPITLMNSLSRTLSSFPSF